MSLGLMMRHHALLAAAAKKGGGSGEIVYLTNFENYNSTTGIDTPIIGENVFWGVNPSLKLSGTSESYTSSIIGDSKRFVVDDFNDKLAIAKIPSFDDSDEISVDFLVSPIFNGRWAGFYILRYKSENSYAEMVKTFYINDYWRRESSRLFGWAVNRGSNLVSWDVDGYDDYDVGWGSRCLFTSNGVEGNTCGVPTKKFGNAFNNNEEHHIAAVISKSKNLYKLFVDGILVHTEQMNIFDNLHFAFGSIYSRFRISNFCVRNFDVSSGDVDGATFPVPTRPYA